MCKKDKPNTVIVKQPKDKQDKKLVNMRTELSKIFDT